MSKTIPIDQLIEKLERELVVAKSDHAMSERLQVLRDTAQKYAGEDEVVSFEDIVAKVKSREELFVIKTGWEKFDEIVRGFRPQQIVLVGALTKSGKTTWCMELTSRIAEHNPLWIPYEESAEELMRKYIERGLTPPHGYTPSITRPNQLDWLEARIVEGIAKYGSRIVFIDHLEFLVPGGQNSLDERYASTMRFLKDLAKKWNVCLVVMVQLRKPESITALPDYNDIKNSSSPAHHCDTAIVLYRETIKKKQEVTITNNTIASIQLNRRFGGTGNVTMVYDGGHYVEQEWREGVLNSEKLDQELNDY
jgi:replicative DNA helicase